MARTDDTSDETTTALTHDRLSRLAVDSAACLVQIYGEGGLGKRYLLAGELTVGRGDDNDVVVEMDSVSRHHAKFLATDEACLVDDLGSTNGTRVNGFLVNGPVQLRNSDLIKIGGAVFKFISGGNIEAMYHDEIYRMTIVDGLTQIHNKRYLTEFLEHEVARCRRHGHPLSLVMFDVDHFKVLNDTYGHLAGDHVLKKIAELVLERVRKEDLFARYGGEEFALALVETPIAGAVRIAEEIRARVEGNVVVFDDVEIRTTISLGVAALAGKLGPNRLVRLADDRLYAAKRAGRNRVQAD